MPERLDAALELAAETLEGYKELGPILGPSEEAAQEYLAGWAEAIRALDEYHPLSEFGQDRSGDCSACDTQRAFIKAMLGEE